MPPIDAISNGPLNPAQQQEVALAQQRAATIRKAAKVAGFNGWMFGIFAALSALFAVFDFSIPGILVTAGLAWIAYREFQGRKGLLQFDPSAATRLGWNQIGLVILITVYCGWMLWEGLTGNSPIAAEFKANPDLASVLSPREFDRIYRLLVILVYGSVIVVSVIFQGWNAAYYFTRRKHIETYVRETPAWVLDLQRLTAVV